MSPATASVLSSALALTDAERSELISALLDKDDWPGGPVGAEWEAELQRRSDEIDAGTAVLIPWEVVRDQARQRIMRRSDG